jgi:CDP-glucose 4,6-dehydratase
MDIGTFERAFRGRRVLVTGHTGFKGSWLALWLNELGAKVTGLALQPASTPNHWDLLDLPIDDRRADIRDAEATRAVVTNARPEIVFHLAAQSLVRRSYQEPLATWATNVVGTANVLDACREVSEMRAIVVVTSDKCYANDGTPRRYRETDQLGGHDPYSASKAATELVAASYRDAFFRDAGSPLLATVRAGNVVGGGDWAQDRLIPDIARAKAAGASLAIRAPDATRPWQHVLECLLGYLALGSRLLDSERAFADAWNFGPDDGTSVSVAQVLATLQRHWPGLRWQVDERHAPHEAAFLALDSTKARTLLGWRPVWSLEEALARTAAWYRDYLDGGRVTSRAQLLAYVNATRARKTVAAL